MAKFSGTVGFATTTETSPGVHTEVINEVAYTGDLLKASRRYSSSDGVNDNVVTNNRVSFLGDTFAIENMSLIRFVRIRGIPWSVKSLDYEYPRIIVSLGEVYNGN